MSEEQLRLQGNVRSLQEMLRLTERSLHGLGPRRPASQRSEDAEIPDLTLDDLSERPIGSGALDDDCRSQRGGSRVVESASTSKMPPVSRVDEENLELRRKLISLCSENSSLVMENHLLLQQLDSANAEITHLEGDVTAFVKRSRDVEDRVSGLELRSAEQDAMRRAAEEALELAQQRGQQREAECERLTRDAERLRAELRERTARTKQADAEKRELSEQLQEVKASFQGYRTQLSESLLQYRSREQSLVSELSRALSECASVSEQRAGAVSDNHELTLLVSTLQENCQTFEAEVCRLKKELETMQPLLGQKPSSSCNVKCGPDEEDMPPSASLGSHDITELRSLLCKKDRELEALQSGAPSSRCPAAQRSASSTQTDDDARLHGDTMAEALQERLREAEVSVASLQSQLSQASCRASQLEAQKKKGSSEMAALCRQLEEKTIAFNASVGHCTELQREVENKTRALGKLERRLREQAQELERAAGSTREKHDEEVADLKRRAATLCEMAEQAEKRMQRAQNEVADHRQALEREKLRAQELQMSLEDTRRQRGSSEEALGLAERKLVDASAKALEMESELATKQAERVRCQEKLQQNQQELQAKTEQLELLNGAVAEAEEQAGELRRALRERDTMLALGAARVEALEEAQAQLQTQVCGLEQSLHAEHEQSRGEQEKSAKQQRALQRQLHEERERGAALASSVSELQAAVRDGQEEVARVRAELGSAREKGSREGERALSLLATLKQAENELRHKTQLATELQDSLARGLQQAGDTEQELGRARAELQRERLAAAELSTELRATERRLHAELHERDRRLHSMAESHGQLRGSLCEREREVEELQVELEERQRELIARATQLSELEGRVSEQVVSLRTEVDAKEEQILQMEARCEQLNTQLKEQTAEGEKNRALVITLQAKSEEKSQALTSLREVCLQLRARAEGFECRLVNLQREVERLHQEIEERENLNREKDEQVWRLAEQLGASQARETQLQSEVQRERELHQQQRAGSSEQGAGSRPRQEVSDFRR
ncbi:coiled-coil domain-containing protein 18-like isoform X2 [Lethenteron reissneri]|uniref:coiled-coil domain-containing protein 18-like isoform X2 n=1 Tax=Lethenteron reissneri TaxID=7753 RepID=UPI002AB694A0|nr:coiled-coil domain-containing protein 18-like isoform X2 [Lethenteron reissneri]